MGTRNLTIIKDTSGKYAVAKYCQWDGYPSGQGITLLNFLNKAKAKLFFVPDLQRRLSENTIKVDEDQMRSLWVECGADPDSGLVSLEVSHKFKSQYPQLHRDMGAEIVELIYNTVGNNTIPIRNYIEFAGDSLFCEYVYMVDLQTRKFRVFRGFNKNPLTSVEEFYFLQDEESEYKPVKECASWSFSNLPSAEEFLKKLDVEEEL